MTSTASAANKFRSVLAEGELDHLEKMLRLAQAFGPVARLDGAYWTARLTYVMEHFDLVAEQSKRLQTLLSASRRATASVAKEGKIARLHSGMCSWAAQAL